MKRFKNLFLLLLTLSTFAMSGCLHLIEEVTFHKNGSGSYKMTIDMSELKGMMDMMKGMQADSTAESPAGDNSMTSMGEQLTNVSATLQNIQGITNVVETNDTTNFQFGYAFDFADVKALNRALKVINKDKYESEVGEVFKYEGKNFERAATADIGEQLKAAMSEAGGEEGADESMDMVKMFFADMSYEQIYHFPDQKVKKQNNKIGVVSEDMHTLTVSLKPFNEDQQKQNPTVAAKVKLKN